MRFLPENKKKALFSLMLLILATVGIVYVNFFLNRATPVPAVPPVAAGIEGGGFLPYGDKINLQILQDPRFTRLKPGPQISVSAEELGKTNLFSGE